MMSRDKLRQLKSSTRKMDFSPSRQLVHTLLDHGMEALDELEGGKSTIDLRAELKERERQIALALKDLEVAIRVEGLSTRKPLFILDMVNEMLKAKGPKWHWEWSWYAARVSEEFDE